MKNLVFPRIFLHCVALGFIVSGLLLRLYCRFDSYRERSILSGNERKIIAVFLLFFSAHFARRLVFLRKARGYMELIENLLKLLVTFIGALLSGISYRKSRRQAYFLLLCFYGCFALGALYWTLYLLLFDTTPRVFYVSEFGWVASVIFLRILQATLSTPEECSFHCCRAWLAPAFGLPLLAAAGRLSTFRLSRRK